jgi:hypothetical protein
MHIIVKSAVFLAWATCVSACATATTTRSATHRRRPAPSTQAAPTPVSPAFPERVPERRRDGGAMDAHAVPAVSFGSPVVSHGGDAGALRPVWAPVEGRPRVRCEGTGPSVIPSTQSPYEPGSATIVRSFLPAEGGVLACRPPVDARGRFPVHALFTNNGAPAELSFPPGVTRTMALCLGAALCDVRMPAFRAANATVDYDFLLAVAR